MITRPKISEKYPIFTDISVVIFLAALVFCFVRIGQHWEAPLQSEVEINLSLWKLPGYTFFSLLRGFFAYGLSLAFALPYGYIAAHRPRAERVMLPLLDILQSIPVLGFLPGVVLALVTLFPNTNVGLEIASILMIFTGQVWNIAFSFHQSLRSIPSELNEVASLYRFSSWQKLLRVELPSSAVGLAWNSMLAMAGGWFFLMICEAFTLRNHDFRLPGLGAYISVAISRDDKTALLAGIVAMILMIISVDTFVWKPLIAWTQKFQMEEGGVKENEISRIGRWLLNSRLVQKMGVFLSSLISQILAWRARHLSRRYVQNISFSLLNTALLVLSGLLILWGAWRMVDLLRDLNLDQWLSVLSGALFTFLRVFAALMLGSLWTIPVGIWIGQSEKRAARFRPFVQVAASFPAPILYPLIFVGLHFLGMGASITATILMLLGTQWYILFNVIAGVVSMPSDISEVAHAYHFKRIQFWKIVWWPAIFPYLVTGWVTAAGGAWNASIVAEFVILGQQTSKASGLGSLISIAAADGHYGVLAASVLTMSIVVALINRFVWKKLYHFAETRYAY